MNLNRFLSIPYGEGGSDWNSCDCYGLVELWYLERFGIELRERGEIMSSPAGLQEGFDKATDWVSVRVPQNDDLIVMRGMHGKTALLSGHIGIYWNGSVIHTQPLHGCVMQPIEGRQIKPRITSIQRHAIFA